ncbi:MAG: hypothetical protein CL534_19370 [Ahrensia sp.]|nr:hypothetical protein [Ahrensia sp.]
MFMSDKPFMPENVEPAAREPEARVAVIAALLVILIGIAGFAGWLFHGETLFWSMLQAGLAWCL